MSDEDSKPALQQEFSGENGRIHAPVAAKNRGDCSVFQSWQQHGLGGKRQHTVLEGSLVARAKRSKEELVPSNQITATAFKPLPRSLARHPHGLQPGLMQLPETPCPEHSVSSVQSSHHGCEEDGAKAARKSTREWGNQPLSVLDPKLWDLMEHEKSRQWKGIELIASENYTSQAVLEALGSHLTNKYSEGYPGARCYGGNEYIDQIEALCCNRALEAFHLDSKSWGVNVQPYSCTSANFAVFTALLQPKDRIMGLDVLSGGHPSHGYTIAGRKKVSATSIHFETLAYSVDPQTGLIDYENLERLVSAYRPAILVCGGSAYPREWKYENFRHLADKYGAILMCDMAHVSGLVATQECVSPFEYCDIVTSTTHKILRGPRGGMVFFRKGGRPRKNGSTAEESSYDYEEKINFTIFRSLQGGPHNNHIAGLAVALKQVASKEYKDYIRQVLQNTKALADAMVRRNFKLVTGGTDNHLLIWDLRPLGITGAWFEKVTELCHITVNKCTVYGDSSVRGPGGIRIGSPAMTSRGCVEKDFETIAELLSNAVTIAQSLQRDCKSQKDPKLASSSVVQSNKDVVELKRKVEQFSSAFEMPGFDTGSMKYR
ncbi:serine hydroxymethyltransferase 4 [Selaginella moellendorffii]|nr:serine hydroxymethyltransferase 4 [Selaginella moellendorffii]|eukprot:XP_002989941.2 serine hydroxymethyltransferase 4 [Selaginella moellendorffii]